MFYDSQFITPDTTLGYKPARHQRQSQRRRQRKQSLNDHTDHKGQDLSPFTHDWYAALFGSNPRAAVAAAVQQKRSGRTDICCICGDERGVADYRISGSRVIARFCPDCRDIQRWMYGLITEGVARR